MRPQFEYGDEVRVLRNVRNDGTFPGQPTGALLIRRGSTGFVRDVGTFLQDQLIYTVHFLDSDTLVGCREEELQPAEAPWTASRFETREKVAARLTLGRGGRVLVEQGQIGEVLKVLRGPSIGAAETSVTYHVHFPGSNVLQVPESALDPVPTSSDPEIAQRPNAKAAPLNAEMAPEPSP
jgi:nitrogen fixation protein NifZ